MAIGDVNIQLTIGSMDVTNTNQVFHDEINIYEDIQSTYGPKMDVRVIDPTDAINTTSINGSYNQDVSVRITEADTGKVAGFKMKLLENNDHQDDSKAAQGSLHSKSYNFRCVSPEFLNAQGNFIEKSWNDKTTNIAKDIIQKYYKSDKQVNIGDESKEKRRWIASNEHPFDVIDKLNDEHVASQSKSSAYCIYQDQKSGTQSYNITTYEKLMQQGSVATLTQSTNLNSSYSDINQQKNSILWCNLGSNFLSLTRNLSHSSEQTVNLSTHGVVTTDDSDTDYKILGQRVYTGKTPNHNLVPQTKVYSKINEKERSSAGDAKRNRAQFLSHLSQNYAELEIPGNPDIHLGSVVTLNIPKKSGIPNDTGSENQFNGPVLVVKIRHRIKPMGHTPRYTMVLGVVKGGWQQGGGTA